MRRVAAITAAAAAFGVLPATTVFSTPTLVGQPAPDGWVEVPHAEAAALITERLAEIDANGSYIGTADDYQLYTRDDGATILAHNVLRVLEVAEETAADGTHTLAARVELSDETRELGLARRDAIDHGAGLPVSTASATHKRYERTYSHYNGDINGNCYLLDVDNYYARHYSCIDLKHMGVDSDGYYRKGIAHFFKGWAKPSNYELDYMWAGERPTSAVRTYFAGTPPYDPTQAIPKGSCTTRTVGVEYKGVGVSQSFTHCDMLTPYETMSNGDFYVHWDAAPLGGVPDGQQNARTGAYAVHHKIKSSLEKYEFWQKIEVST